MTIFFGVVDLLIPATMIIFAIIFKVKPPDKINCLYGYRTSRSMKTQEAWDYAHKKASKLLLVFGSIIFVVVIFNKLYFSLRTEYLSLINNAIGILGLLIIIPIVERDLKSKF